MVMFLVVGARLLKAREAVRRGRAEMARRVIPVGKEFNPTGSGL